MLDLSANGKYKYPGGRYYELGSESGEEIREKVLIPWLQSAEYDGHLSFGQMYVLISSTGEEIFGGAVRRGFVKQMKELEFHLTEHSGNDEDDIKKFKGYIADAVKYVEKYGPCKQYKVSVQIGDKLIKISKPVFEDSEKEAIDFCQRLRLRGKLEGLMHIPVEEYVWKVTQVDK